MKSTNLLPSSAIKYFPVSPLANPVWAPPLPTSSAYLRSELLKPLTTRGNENDDDDSNDDDCTYLITLAHNDSGEKNVDDDEKQ